MPDLIVVGNFNQSCTDQSHSGGHVAHSRHQYERNNDAMRLRLCCYAGRAVFTRKHVAQKNAQGSCRFCFARRWVVGDSKLPQLPQTGQLAEGCSAVQRVGVHKEGCEAQKASYSFHCRNLVPTQLQDVKLRATCHLWNCLDGEIDLLLS